MHLGTINALEVQLKFFHWHMRHTMPRPFIGFNCLHSHQSRNFLCIPPYRMGNQIATLRRSPKPSERILKSGFRVRSKLRQLEQVLEELNLLAKIHGKRDELCPLLATRFLVAHQHPNRRIEKELKPRKPDRDSADN